MSTSDPSPPIPPATLVEELDQVILDFEALQSELTYVGAKGVLQTIVDRLSLTPREAAGLQPEVQALTNLQEKLNQTVVQIAVFGLVGRGKSSVLNALLGQSVFATGPTHGVTQDIEKIAWRVPAAQELARDVPAPAAEAADVVEAVETAAAADTPTYPQVSLPGLGKSRIELIDTPGLDEVNGQLRGQLASAVAAKADLILFVIAGDITQVEYEALVQLRQVSKPILLVFNKIDQYPEADRMAIFNTLKDQRLRSLISPDEIVMTAAAPLIAVATPRADGRLRPTLQRGQPQVEALKLKILEILDREGLSLVALNTLLYADELNDAILTKKLQIRNRAADELIWQSVMAKAIAVALNPVTVLDVLTGAIVDVAMIVTLSRLYGLPMTQAGAVKLLRSIALEVGGLSVSELLVTFGLSSLKGLLGASAPATGGFSLAPYTSVAITQAAVVGVATYGIGLVTKAYLANGAQWGPQGPKAMVKTILDGLDETSLISRIKDELATKVKTSGNL